MSVDQQLLAKDLVALSAHVKDWPNKARVLGFSESDIEDILVDNATNRLRKSAMMVKWGEMQGEMATLGSLLAIAKQNDWRELIQGINKRPEEASVSEIEQDVNNGDTWKLCLVKFVPAFLVAVLIIYQFYPTILYYVHKANSKNLPYLSNYEHFIGREKEVEDIVRLLDYSTSESARIVNIYGSPGFGKSTLAIYAGHQLLEKGVNIHYLNLFDCPNDVRQCLAEKIKYNSDPQEVVTFDAFLQWVRGRNFYDLILLDNCDETLHRQKEEMQYVVEKVIQNSQNFKFLITSREITSYVGSFESYKLYELSKRAACNLLEHKIPSTIKANLSEREELAELTGGVPLALQIVGSLLRLPDLAKPAILIKELKAEPILTLSPKQLPENKKINASFSLSYKYLNNKEKRIGQFLSNFPGTFRLEAGIAIIGGVFNLTSNMVKPAIATLVQRSLLEYSHDNDRYHFHSLIREYFLVKQSESKRSRAREFTGSFQGFFFLLLKNASGAYNSLSFKKSLAILDAERHNFLQLFTDLEAGIIKCNLELAIGTIIKAIQEKLLMCRFSYKELLHIVNSSMVFLDHLDSTEWEEVRLDLVYHIIDFHKRINSSEVAIDAFENYNENKVLTFRKNSRATRRLLYMVSDLCSDQGRYNDSYYYYSYIVECGEGNCSNKDLGRHFRRVDDHEKAAYYLRLSLSEEEDSFTKLVLLFQLRSVYIGLGQNSAAESVLENITLMVPNIITLPHYKLFQNMETIDVMISVLRDLGKSDTADLLEGCAIDVIFTMGAEVNVEILYPNKSLIIVEALYRKGEYQKAVELGTFAIERSRERNQSTSNLIVTVAMAKWSYGNYSAGWDDMEAVLRDAFYGDHQNIIKLCFYLIPRLKYITPCFIRPVYDVLCIVFKLTLHIIFVQPIDVTNYYNDDVTSDNSQPIATSFFPELAQQSRSKEVIAPTSGVAYMHILFKYEEKLIGKLFIQFAQQMCSDTKTFMTKIPGIIQHPLLGFLINVLSIIVRLDIAFFIVFVAGSLIFAALVYSLILIARLCCPYNIKCCCNCVLHVKKLFFSMYCTFLLLDDFWQYHNIIVLVVITSLDIMNNIVEYFFSCLYQILFNSVYVVGLHYMFMETAVQSLSMRKCFFVFTCLVIIIVLCCSVLSFC